MYTFRQTDLAKRLAGKSLPAFSGLDVGSVEEIEERIGDLTSLLHEELEMAVRVNKRAWNRVKDTHADIIDKMLVNYVGARKIT